MSAFTEYGSGLKTPGFLHEVLKPRYAQSGMLGCLFMRVENYEIIVQRFGHVRAEAAAIQTGQRLQEALTNIAEVVRHGTHTYLAIIPCNGELKAWGEVCKWYVQQAPVVVCNKPVGVELSVGEAHRTSWESVDELVERADNDLLEKLEVKQ